jgi:hypothetical protein
MERHRSQRKTKSELGLRSLQIGRRGVEKEAPLPIGAGVEKHRCPNSARGSRGLRGWLRVGRIPPRSHFTFLVFKRKGEENDGEKETQERKQKNLDPDRVS